MSTSTDAILFFGMVWDEEGIPRGKDDLEEDEDADPIIDDIDNLDRVYAHRKGLDASKLPFEFFTHCHREAPMLALAVKGTKTRAWRGFPKEINPSGMVGQTLAFKEAELREVCKTLGLKPGKFGWWLVSDWS